MSIELSLSTNYCILYILAHICDSTTSTWYKFNDEAVEKMEGKKLTLGSEEDVVGKL
jgi:ubiquitin carboxyl-terminal hydrolase 48